MSATVQEAVMNKRTFFWLAGLLSLQLPLVAACGGNFTQPGTSPGTSIHAPAAGSLYILDGYTAGRKTTQQIVEFNPAQVNATTMTLPAGLTSVDHQRIYTAATSGGRTKITVLDARTGVTLRAFSIPGTYSTSDRGVTDSMLSGDGHWLALRALDQSPGTTSIVLLDTQAGKLVKTIHLNGEFTLDALSPGGKILYLLEYYERGTSHYNVRAYNIAAGQLAEGLIADKRQLGENMQGEALTRQMAADGSTAYTLYINTATNTAFIHILKLPDDISQNSGTPWPVIARCLDLPVGRSAALLHYYTLTLSANGSTLFAVNAALGLVGRASVKTENAFDIDDPKTDHFTPEKSLVSGNDQARLLHNGAALSPDGSRLYVVGLHGIWVLNPDSLHVQSTYMQKQIFTGVAVSPDGSTLYAVSPETGITLLDARSGQAQQVLKSPAHAPWGVEWISK